MSDGDLMQAQSAPEKGDSGYSSETFGTRARNGALVNLKKIDLCAADKS